MIQFQRHHLYDMCHGCVLINFTHIHSWTPYLLYLFIWVSLYLNCSPITTTAPPPEGFWTEFTGPVAWWLGGRSLEWVTVYHAGGGEMVSSGSRARLADRVIHLWPYRRATDEPNFLRGYSNSLAAVEYVVACRDIAESWVQSFSLCVCVCGWVLW